MAGDRAVTGSCQARLTGDDEGGRVGLDQVGPHRVDAAGDEGRQVGEGEDEERDEAGDGLDQVDGAWPGVRSLVGWASVGGGLGWWWDGMVG
jgi:hypothetical protein